MNKREILNHFASQPNEDLYLEIGRYKNVYTSRTISAAIKTGECVIVNGKRNQEDTGWNWVELSSISRALKVHGKDVEGDLDESSLVEAHNNEDIYGCFGFVSLPDNTYIIKFAYSSLGRRFINRIKGRVLEVTMPLSYDVEGYFWVYVKFEEGESKVSEIGEQYFQDLAQNKGVNFIHYNFDISEIELARDLIKRRSAISKIFVFKHFDMDGNETSWDLFFFPTLDCAGRPYSPESGDVIVWSLEGGKGVSKFIYGNKKQKVTVIKRDQFFIGTKFDKLEGVYSVQIGQRMRTCATIREVALSTHNFVFNGALAFSSY